MFGQLLFTTPRLGPNNSKSRRANRISMALTTPLKPKRVTAIMVVAKLISDAVLPLGGTKVNHRTMTSGRTIME